MIENDSLKRVESIRDLGVLMDKELTFSKHIQNIISKSYSMLGFVMRICKDFSSIQALKSVYFAHVRSYLEYASVVWHPYKETYINKIESIQKKFLIYALRRTVLRDNNFKLPPYITRCESIGLEVLARRRINACAFFAFDLMRKRLDAPALLSDVVIKQPTRDFRPTIYRQAQFLEVHGHRTA